MCVCVCSCVCVCWKRERESERVRVCVCVCERERERLRDEELIALKVVGDYEKKKKEEWETEAKLGEIIQNTEILPKRSRQKQVSIFQTNVLSLFLLIVMMIGTKIDWARS